MAPERHLSVRGAHVFVSDLRLTARVGVNPNEQGGVQPVIVDVWVGMEDIEHPARSERLADALDYVAVARTVRQVVEERHWPLVESLATRIAQAVLGRPGATWVRVRLRKPNSLRHASAAGVEVELGLDEARERPQPLAPADLAAPEEILVLGGGVAGLAAALWCWRLGHPGLIVDADEELGGQLRWVFGAMPDLTGMSPLTGSALRARLVRQLAHHDGRWLRARVKTVQSDDGAPRVQLDDGTELRPRAVILTLGARRRELGIPGEQELAGRGVLATGARETEQLAGRRVVVVGSGDAACENALALARQGARVTLISRRPRLSARRQFASQVQAEPSLAVRLSARPLRFLGTERLQAVLLETPDGQEELPAEAALVRIGWLPNTEALPREWCDERGYVRADADGRVAGERAVFVAGDLLGRLCASVATAVGSAAVAARAAVDQLEG
jgi:thioredoxin reductase (NADPH)